MPRAMRTRSDVSESIDGKQRDLFEEMGVLTDEETGADLKRLEQLMPKRRRM